MNNQSSLSLGERALYVAPCVEVIEVETEGVIAGSTNTNLPDIGNGGPAYGSASGRMRSYNAASSSDLEDMISNCLTIED